MLAQDADVVILVHPPVDLNQMSQDTVPDAPPEHDALSGHVATVLKADWRVPFVGAPTDEHSAVALPDRRMKLVTEDHPTPVSLCGPLLDKPRPSHPCPPYPG